MILIIAHHYVVNSGLTDADGPIYSNLYSWRSVFLLLFGAWGKTGINCFVMITGYFMCKSKITMKKFMKLLLEIYFYRFLLYGIFLLTKYSVFSVKEFFKLCLPFTKIDRNFTGCYLVFFLFIPFLNILIQNMNEKQHIGIIALCGMVYVLIGSVPKIVITFNYVTWFFVIYLIASYIRLYPKKLWENTRLWGLLTVILWMFACISVVVCAWLPPVLGMTPRPYEFLADSNKIFAVCIGITAFLYFKNLKIKNSIFINRIGATTFGILLIHANSDTMRQWLWKDMLNNVGMYDSGWTVPHAILSVTGIFLICSVIDSVRMRFIEMPLFDRWKFNREV